jgi:glyoxylase-like metal-dependent hydrolase (beta-lactamase superfamily II)
MALTLGRFVVHEVLGGAFALDGGAMFGIIPKPVWEKELAPDARNRVPIVSRSLLVETGNKRVLVDAGPGSRWSEKERALYDLDPTVEIRSALKRVGTDPEAITDVIVTHLHWDHAGGLTFLDPATGAPRLTFPNAVHHVQRRNWRWAHLPTDRDRKSYRPEDYDLLEQSGRVHFVEGETEILEGIQLLPSDGHTVGQQLVRLQDGGETLLFCGDIIPTSAHIRTTWGMGYDLYPLTVIEEKKQILAQALEEGWILFFEHDPRIAACRVEEKDGRAAAGEEVHF